MKIQGVLWVDLPVASNTPSASHWPEPSQAPTQLQGELGNVVFLCALEEGKGIGEHPARLCHTCLLRPHLESTPRIEGVWFTVVVPVPLITWLSKWS